MSWQDAVNTPFLITTGDGKEYQVLWKNTAQKEVDYNIAEFDFPLIAGSLVVRGTNKARKFSLDIIFQGEDHLDNSLTFEQSANDPRAWKIKHPIYGALIVHPISLKFDYSGFNTTHITGVIHETITFGGPKVTQVPFDKIIFDKAQLDETTAQSYQADIQAFSPGIKDVNTLTGFNKTLYDIGIKTIKLTEDAGKYFNAFNAANASILALTASPLLAMRDLQTVINYPSLFINTIQARVASIQSQFDSLSAQIGNITRVSDKRSYQASSVTLVSSMAAASITSYDANGNQVTTGSLPDYVTKADVIAIIEALQALFDQLIANLDSLQTDNGGDKDSYIPDAESLTALEDLINFTISNLYSIALSSKQERIVILEKDSNAILLTHRFYGLLNDDSTIDQFINSNGILLNELLQIKKGRELKFYI